jgi:uncharacterized protein YodC (DUF2158 family)
MGLNIGDVVFLKSGGLPMTVERISEVSVVCTWLDGAKHLHGSFAPETLETREQVSARHKREAEQQSNDYNPLWSWR